jgi:signal transduction histidine kinase
MVPPPEINPREHRRHQRDRLLILGLVLLILGPFLPYAWIAVGAAREIARHDALEGNLATAQLGARLIDEQCDVALTVLNTLAQCGLPEQALTAPESLEARRSIEVPLRSAMEVLPDLILIAAYRPNGTLMASYPRSPAPARDASREDWFRGVSRARVPYVSDVSRLQGKREEQVVVLGVPVGSEKHPVAYLMGLYRLRDVHNWLRPLRIGSGGILFVADADGQLVAASSNLGYGALQLAEYPPVFRALQEEQGALEAPNPDGHGKALIGYAPARVPGWAVVAVQPVEAALAPADHLLRRMALLVVPILGLMIGAGGSIERLYRRQAHLAQQNAVLSRDLALQNEKLRAADRAKSEFLANVSHDLRTPLASIKASVSGLLEPDIEWDLQTARGFLSLVNEEADRLIARVRNLLDMTRIEAQALPMRKEVCDLTDIVASAIERVEPLTRGREIHATFPHEPLLVEVDYAQIETVILNLLENALKYSPPDTPLYLHGEVFWRPAMVGASPGSGQAADRRPSAHPDRLGPRPQAVFTLRDEGPGIRAGDEGRVFEKFYRAPTGSSGGGTGLGLAICKAIVAAHGGEIGVRRPCEGGAEFWFSLPLYPDGHGEQASR